MDGFVESIKQYPGQQQVDRSVNVKVPGKHFPQLQASEQAAMYWGTAVEFRDRQKFPRHAKMQRRGGRSTQAPESGSSAIPTPSTTRTTKASGQRWHCGIDGAMRPSRMTLWPEAETQYLDELPDAKAAAAPTKAAGLNRRRRSPQLSSTLMSWPLARAAGVLLVFTFTLSSRRGPHCPLPLLSVSCAALHSN